LDLTERYTFLHTDILMLDEILMVYNGSNRIDKAFYLEGDGSIVCSYPTVKGILG